MKLAVVGTGIAGLATAHLLHREHDLTLYEAADRIGGHTHTVVVDGPDGPLPVDTGFIVFNLRTYPNFVRLLEELGVPWQSSDMSFSATGEALDLEYNGTSLNTLFAQRTNLVRPAFWRMVRDILRFYREARELLAEEHDRTTLGEYLERGRYSREFVDWHLLPMASAVWSARREDMQAFPARYLVRFFENHGFLQVEDRPEWLVVRGGSHAYVDPLTAPFRDRIRLSTPVTGVRRLAQGDGGGVEVTAADGSAERYDEVVLALHSDQALRVIADASPLEREVLGAFAYQENEAVLHTDASLLPRRRLARASWNYHLADDGEDRATVTYWMNRLQSLPGDTPYCVTLNRTHRIDPARVLRRMTYHHPVYTPSAVAAQGRWSEVSGVDRVHFCGAYWGYGFHEDGVNSALAVGRTFGAEL